MYLSRNYDVIRIYKTRLKSLNIFIYYITSMVLLNSKTLPMGWKAIDFDLPSTEGRFYTLSDFKDKDFLLIFFTCNHCPYAKASWPIIIGLSKLFVDKVNFVAINPNDDKDHPDDSFETMKDKITEWGIPFPYLRDESQQIAKAYEAQCTPDIYLFKKDGEDFSLFYHGRVNDNWQKPEEVKEENLKEALEKITTGQNPPEIQHPSMGCSIKWKV